MLAIPVDSSPQGRKIFSGGIPSDGIEIVNGKKVKREFKGTAFIDLAGKHGVVPSSADRIYRGAIDKLRKALEDDKWL